MNHKKNILFISIACDMYGSSKVLLSLVLQMKQDSEEYNPIVCLPPEEGPLRQNLINAGIQIIEMPVVKLTRSMLKSLNFIGLFREYFRAKKVFRQETRGITVDAIQSNTLATMFGAMYCKFRKTKHVIHVHEIMDRPKIASFFFKMVLKYCCDEIVYNSEATAEFYNGMAPTLKNKSATIVNGVDRNRGVISEEERSKIRTEMFRSSPEEFIIGLLGRFNRLKGHQVTLETFKEIYEEYPKLKLCFIGSPPPNQEHFLVNLRERIASMGLDKRVQIMGFQDDVFAILEALDLVVVPSTEPESFGLVVVEAMLAGTAVIGSDIGGISTIIDHGKTGLLFEPNDKNEFKNAIVSLLNDGSLKAMMEKKAMDKAKIAFSSEAMFQKFNLLYRKII
ncbi:MAG: glycosyltransferase family 4 protein [Bacteroidia bacterium]|nr:glycosyltransferase family 4 protein [Bacteroidia bacterium]NNF31516.1 glycosyltransferase family 4 protein [Flavobacteriaceae bacterium]MBT8275591.1 glycosyltransferase family 4 protein [Bacteroidia bacterium]NNJ82781.1 glycosyltransferase family 4 protein [Flavobacteriaceae bacterium]NNK54095.1 glycosyltransferase family 4 protein [Flavobacteriaceae bacterium]